MNAKCTLFCKSAKRYKKESKSKREELRSKVFEVWSSWSKFQISSTKSQLNFKY